MRSPQGNELRQLDGNASDIWDRGDTWVTLGRQMKSTARELEAIGDSSVHKSKGTEKLAEMASETAVDLKAAGVRYVETGKVLRTYGTALDTAQTWIRNHKAEVISAENAYQAALQAKADALDEQSSLDSRWPWEDEPTDKERTAAASEVSQATTSLTSAKTHRDEMWQQFDTCFGTWSEAYDDAVGGIEKAMETAGNNDGFWEFVDDVLNVVAIVLIVLSVIALVIGAPLTGLLGLAILGLTLLTVGLTLLKFAFGKASLSDVLWSMVGLLPFGIGKILSRGIPTLATVMRSGRGLATSAIRAGLPRLNLARPSTWFTPLRSAFAPVRSWLHLPRPGAFVNPFRTIVDGGPEVAQIRTFLDTMSKSAWGNSPAVQQFIRQTTGALPGVRTMAINAVLWTGFTANDIVGLVGATPDIPGAKDVVISW